MPKKYAKITKSYNQKSIRDRLEAFFLDNIGNIITREQILQVARNPVTGKEPENWHQRVSELRTDLGYRILTYRDHSDLKVSEYLLLSPKKNPNAKARVYIDPITWNEVLKRANNKCEWTEGNTICGLANGDIDPIGGGTIRLTADHKNPHSSGIIIDRSNPDEWRALCGRHQVMKKNYWDNITGKLNIINILQSIPHKEKVKAYKFLKEYFKTQ